MKNAENPMTVSSENHLYGADRLPLLFCHRGFEEVVGGEGYQNGEECCCRAGEYQGYVGMRVLRPVERSGKYALHVGEENREYDSRDECDEQGNH